MSAIWSALVPETTKTVDKYLSEILAELQKEVTSGINGQTDLDIDKLKDRWTNCDSPT